jgi:hypothetical protein
MIGFIGLFATSCPPEKKGKRQRSHIKQTDKEMDYRIRRTGVLFKPPCGAAFNGVVLSDKVKSLPAFVC